MTRYDKQILYSQNFTTDDELLDNVLVAIYETQYL